MANSRRDECINKLLALTFPNMEDLCSLENYNIEEIYKDGIKILDEVYSLDDITSIELDKIIDEFLYITGRNKGYFYCANPITDNLNIFLINRYKDKVSDKFLFERIFVFWDKENFRNYIDYNEERLRNFISQNEFYIDSKDDSKIHISFYSRGCDVYYFYTQFKDILRLSNKDWNSIFQCFSDKQLYNLVLTSLENEDEMLDCIINSDAVLYLVCRGLKLHDNVFDLYLKLLKKNVSFSVSDDLLILEYLDRHSSSLGSKYNYSIPYFYNLGILERISKEERKAHPYYKECYNIFYDVMKSRINDLSAEEDYILEGLFQRILDGKSFLLITSINNKGSLVLYYKTNFFFKNTKNIAATDIDSISSEQWIYIRDNFYDHFDLNFLNSLSDFESKFSSNFLTQRVCLSDDLVELFVILGFDFLKFIIEKSNCMKGNVRGFIVSELKSLLELGLLNDLNYSEQIKKFIIEFLNDESMNINVLSGYISFYTYLYKKNYPDTSFNILKRLISNNSSLSYIVNSDSMPRFIYNNLGKNSNIIFSDYIKYLKEDKFASIPKLDNDFSKFTNIEVILLELYDRKISSELLDVTNDLDYFYKLSVLKTISRKERKNHPYYDECYSVYFDVMKTRIKDMTDEDIYMVKKLFNRIINGESFLLITSIDNRASLLLYYKTNFYFENAKKQVSVDDINSVSSRQWMYVVNHFTNHFDGKFTKSSSQADSVYFPGCIYLKDFFVESVIKLGYEFFDSLIQNENITTDIYVNIMMQLQPLIEQKYFVNKYFENKDYCEKIKFLLIGFINDEAKDINNLRKYISIFTYLYQNEYPRLTYHRVKMMASDISALLFPNNYHIKDNLDKLDFVAKGEPFIEKTHGIVLYNKYRRRIKSSIPNYVNNYNGLEFGTVDMHDVNIISNGIGKYIYPDNKRASSCLTPNGKAASCLEHGAVDPNGRFFYVKKDGRIIAYSWMWRSGNVLCFDNIEHTEEYLNIVNKEECIYNIYMMAARDIVGISNEFEGNPIKVVVLGRNPIDVKNSYFDSLPDVNNKYGAVFKPKDCEKLYMKDSESKQYLLVDSEDELSLDNVESIYLVSRGEVRKLGFDMERVNAIYFDYCVEKCIKYTPLLRSEFKSGYIGDDWFYGEKVDGSIVLYETLDDDRRKDEIRKYTSIVKSEVGSICIPKNKIERLNYLLDSSNYCCDTNGLKEYLASIDTCFELSGSEFFHGTKGFDNYMKILKDGAISSAYVRNANSYGGNNGKYFISVARVNTRAFEHYKAYCGFLLHEDILAFDTSYGKLVCEDNVFLSASDYYIRPDGIEGEWQVYSAIPLDRTKVVMVPDIDTSMGRAIYLAEECGYDFPFVYTPDMKLVDNEEIKRLIKVK